MEQQGERESLFTGNGYRIQHPQSPYTTKRQRRKKVHITFLSLPSAIICQIFALVAYLYLEELMAGLGVAIALMCFELLAFLVGLTMFNSTSALLSIGSHASACILLCYFILDSWQCGWFWWIFSFGSVLPFLNDVFIVFDVLFNKKY